MDLEALGERQRSVRGAGLRLAPAPARRLLPSFLSLLLGLAAPTLLTAVPSAQGLGAPDATRTLERWSAFAEREGLRLDPSADGRVLLVTAARHAPRRGLQLVERTLARVDALLASEPPPAAKRAGRRAAPRATATAAPEPAGATPAGEVAVLVEALDAAAYARLLAHVAELEPYLAGWASSAAASSGFVLERPLCAAWLADSPELEEWDPENELVHRTARLVVLARHGRLPAWLELGLAWRVEEEVCGSVRCLPGRAGFVGAGEGGSWPARLERAARAGRAPDVARLAAWRRGTWDEDAALAAWGTVRFVEEQHPGALAGVLADLARLRAERGVVRHPDGSWELVPDYEPAAAEQVEAFARHLGAGFAEELARGLGR